MIAPSQITLHQPGPEEAVEPEHGRRPGRPDRGLVVEQPGSGSAPAVVRRPAQNRLGRPAQGDQPTGQGLVLQGGGPDLASGQSGPEKEFDHRNGVVADQGTVEQWLDQADIQPGQVKGIDRLPAVEQAQVRSGGPTRPQIDRRGTGPGKQIGQSDPDPVRAVE